MAASRSTAPAPSTLAPRRISFARINEPLEVPDLLALQTSSFKWLIGSAQVTLRTVRFLGVAWLLVTLCMSILLVRVGRAPDVCGVAGP